LRSKLDSADQNTFRGRSTETFMISEPKHFHLSSRAVCGANWTRQTKNIFHFWSQFAVGFRDNTRALPLSGCQQRRVAHLPTRPPPTEAIPFGLAPLVLPKRSLGTFILESAVVDLPRFCVVDRPKHLPFLVPVCEANCSRREDRNFHSQ
jgi:hypothetical protein